MNLNSHFHLLQITLSYGMFENKRNIINMKGVFPVEEDPSRYRFFKHYKNESHGTVKQVDFIHVSLFPFFSDLNQCTVCSILILHGVLLRLPIKATSSSVVSSSRLCLSIWKALGTSVVLAHVAALFLHWSAARLLFFLPGCCAAFLWTLPSCLVHELPAWGAHSLSGKKRLSAPSFTGNQLCLRPSCCFVSIAILIECVFIICPCLSFCQLYMLSTYKMRFFFYPLPDVIQDIYFRSEVISLKDSLIYKLSVFINL